MKQTNIIIIEGPDCAGKSTLAGSTIFMGEQKDHCGPPKIDPFNEYWSLLQARTEGPLQRNTWVLDRFHLGEHVYGPIIRGEDRLGQAKSAILNRMLMAHRVVVVSCMPPLEVVQYNHEHSPKHQLPDMDQITKIYEAYAKLFTDAHFPLPWVKYDYRIESVYELNGKIMNASRDCLNPYSGMGRFRNRNILVVSQNSRDTDSPEDVAIAQSLIDHGIHERSVYWMKLTDFRREAQHVLNDMRPAGVITLDHGSADEVATAYVSARSKVPITLHVDGNGSPDDVGEAALTILRHKYTS